MGILDAIKKILLGIAPVAASAIGTPAAGIAVAAISRALFGHDDAKQEDIYSALQNITPEQVLSLKIADNDLLRMQLQENQNARNREMSYIDKMGHADWIMAYLVFFVTFMYGGLVFFSVYVPDRLETEIMKDMQVFLGFIMGYYFCQKITPKSS